MDSFYDRAYSLLSSEKARAAFDIEQEEAAVRDEYGRNQAGARMLLARRLVEAGVRFVTLTYGGWDMHNNIQQGMNRQVPAPRSRTGHPDSGPGPAGDARIDSRLRGHRIRPHAEGEWNRGAGPLAQGIQHSPGRRGYQTGHRLSASRTPRPPNRRSIR
jgi:hypothetical protein